MRVTPRGWRNRAWRDTSRPARARRSRARGSCRSRAPPPRAPVASRQGPCPDAGRCGRSWPPGTRSRGVRGRDARRASAPARLRYRG